MSSKIKNPICRGENFSGESAVRQGEKLIFVVEDEDVVRGLVCRLLGASGFQVMNAADANKARALWMEHRERIDLLLVDMMMPGEMNGIALAAVLRREKPELKVVYTSGYNAEAAELELIPGAGFVQKPFTPEELLDVVQNALENS